MRDIQREGTPTNAPAPASSPNRRRRVIGTDLASGMVGTVKHHRYMGEVRGKGTRRRKVHLFKALPSKAAPATLTFLDFRAAAAFNPATFSERLSFRPAHWSQRPEANARQRDAPSGVKVFGRSLAKEVVIPREGGGSSIPEVARLGPTRRGVLDAPVKPGHGDGEYGNPA